VKAATLDVLHLNGIGLGEAGCSESLCDAFRHNKSLSAVSLGENRLRDTSAKLLASFLDRAYMYQSPFESIDFNGNLIRGSALKEFAASVSRLPVSKTMKRKYQDELSATNHFNFIIKELNLRDNLFNPEDLKVALPLLKTRIKNIYSSGSNSINLTKTYHDEV
jgi:hypothetical protein